MRRLSVLVVCILLVSVAGSAVADDDVLTRFWKEQREAAQPQAMQAHVAPGVPASKTLVGLEFTGDELQGGRLAGTIAAYQAHALA